MNQIFYHYLIIFIYYILIIILFIYFIFIYYILTIILFINFLFKNILKKMQLPGVEPGSAAWKAAILPLDHKCTIKIITIMYYMNKENNILYC